MKDVKGDGKGKPSPFLYKEDVFVDAVISPAGDRALTVTFGNRIDEELSQKVSLLDGWIEKEKIPGVIETIPAYCSLLVLYDPEVTEYETLREKILSYKPLPGSEKEAKIVLEIPVCYGGEYGEDLPGMEKLCGLPAEEIIKIHSSVIYRIYMLGFLPGFVYLGGLDKRICAARLDNPRTEIPAGSVGIGGVQTGVYPIASPGGWRLIGRTPVRFYDPGRKDPILCRAGEYIHFVPVTKEEYALIASDVQSGTYRVKKSGGGS